MKDKPKFIRQLDALGFPCWSGRVSRGDCAAVAVNERACFVWVILRPHAYKLYMCVL